MTKTTSINPIDLLVDAVTPTLDEAMDAYKAYTVFGGTDDFATWNDKWASDYIDRKFETLGNPPSTETSTPSNSTPKPSEPTKAIKPTKAVKAPAKPAKPSADGKKTAPAKLDKPAALAKSGNVEVTLTPAEKSKREAQLFTVTNSILVETCGVFTSYFRIGYELWKVQEGKLYLAADLKNVYEYAETAFSFKKSSTANFIAVCKKFSCKDKLGNPTDKIDPAFSLFGYSQLSLMLPLSDETLANVKPEMTANEIRDLKKVQTFGQSDETDLAPANDETDPAPANSAKTVYYDGEVTTSTWDRLLEKLEKLIDSGKHIQITISD